MAYFSVETGLRWKDWTPAERAVWLALLHLAAEVNCGNGAVRCRIHDIADAISVNDFNGKRPTAPRICATVQSLLSKLGKETAQPILYKFADNWYFLRGFWGQNHSVKNPNHKAQLEKSLDAIPDAIADAIRDAYLDAIPYQQKQEQKHTQKQKQSKEGGKPPRVLTPAQSVLLPLAVEAVEAIRTACAESGLTAPSECNPENAAMALDQLQRLDGLLATDAVKTLRWALLDSFWHRLLLSPACWRSKSKSNGLRKMVNANASRLREAAPSSGVFSGKAAEGERLGGNVEW